MTEASANILAADLESLIWDRNCVPLPTDLNSNIPINLPNHTIELGYSIISDNPNRVNDALNGAARLTNIKKVALTKYIDCTLASPSPPVFNPLAPNPPNETSLLTKWEVTGNGPTEYSKTIFAGTGPTNISNNGDLWYNQILCMEESIRFWLFKTLYPNGYASPKVSINMNDYNVYVGEVEGANVKLKVNSCYELLTKVRNVNSNANLRISAKYSTVNCTNIAWTSYNRLSSIDILSFVEQIINNPGVSVSDASVCGEAGCCYNNYLSSVNFHNGNPNIVTFPGRDGTLGSTAQGNTGAVDNVILHVYNEMAEVTYESLNSISNNFCVLKNTVYVDAFVENANAYKENPYLLQLDFYTQFYFKYLEKPALAVNQEQYLTFNTDNVLWNPSPQVYAPTNPFSSVLFDGIV